MKVHLRADSADGVHTKFTVFMSGVNCGQLCMTEDEAVFFHQLIVTSPWKMNMFNDEIFTSGRWTKEVEEGGQECHSQ